jgi:hypothetical protein
VSAGSYAVLASFPGDANYLPATASGELTIARATPVLTWSPPAAIGYGSALGDLQLNAHSTAPGTFDYSPAAGTLLQAGAGQPLSVTFVPADTANYEGGTATTTIDVLPAPLSIAATDASKRFGAPMPVFSAFASGLVAGDSMANLGGALVFSTPATQQSPVGAYPIVVSGVTSPNYAITFVNGTLTVVRGTVAVAVTTSPAPSGSGQPMSFTAALGAVLPAPAAPEGVVHFFDGSTLIGSAPLSEGTATVATAGLDPGSRPITARYDGDGSFEPGAGTATHVVLDAAATPSIAMSSTRNPSNHGQTVTISAMVSRSGVAMIGVVDFYDDAEYLGSGTLESGSARLTTSALALGSHGITARYRGAADVPPVRSPVMVQAVGGPGWKDRASSIELTCGGDTILLGEPATCVADVTGWSNWLPTGRVVFMVNGEVAGEVTLWPAGDTTGRARFSVGGLNHGRHTVTATYLGDSNYQGSTAAVVQAVN